MGEGEYGSVKFDWERYVSFNLKIILIVMAFIVLFKGEWVWLAGTMLSLLIVFTPAILEKDFNVKLPVILDFAITISIFLHVIGGYAHLYAAIPFYDNITHFISSATISFMAVALLYVLTYSLKILKMPPLGFGLLTVFFAMSMGVFWEFMEWMTDLLVGTGLQVGLNDTMIDLMFDTIAGTVVGTLAVFQLRTGKSRDTESILKVGDVRNSSGYRRIKERGEKDATLTKSIVKSFKDPLVMDTIIEYIVKESKYISESQRRLWESVKEKD
ncbi:MAG: hypothetical protein PHU53_04745 [Thermoplasmata archaeon]|nr:hypothetical protein [Thermoplasmata archaeon]